MLATDSRLRWLRIPFVLFMVSHESLLACNRSEFPDTLINGEVSIVSSKELNDDFSCFSYLDV